MARDDTISATQCHLSLRRGIHAIISRHISDSLPPQSEERYPCHHLSPYQRLIATSV